MLGRGFFHQGQRLAGIGPVGHTDGHDDPDDLVGQGPVEQPTGDELLVGHEQFFAVPAANRGCPNADSGHDPVGITDRHDVSNPNGTFEKDNQTADKVGDHFLQAETDTDAEGGYQPLKLGPAKTDGIEGEQGAQGYDGIDDQGGGRVTAPGGQVGETQQNNFRDGR